MTSKTATARRRVSTRPAKTSKALSARRTPRLETILVPIDFSAASLYPVKWAKFIARRTRGNIHFVSVHDFGYPVSTALTPPGIGSDAEIRDQLHKDLQMVALSEKVRPATFHIRAGRPFAQICQLASEIRAGLIVLSTHGRTGWERALMGSTTEKIIRHAQCPVLVARPLRSRRKTEIALRRIVVPVDFSDCSERGLEYAIGLAKLFGAKLSLLNVIQLHHDLPPVVIYSPPRINRWAREVAEAHMTDLVRATDFGGVKYETEIKFGSPAQKICRFAVQEGADLILTSTHGRTGLRHALIGSTAERIIRYARSQVLVVPSRSETGS